MAMRQQKRGSILDPISDELDQRIFDGITPRAELFDPYVERITNTMRDSGFDPDAFDFFLNGSLCTYQYSDGSDVDISVIAKRGIDFSEDDRVDLIRTALTLDGLKIAPEAPYLLQHFVQPPGVTVYDLFGLGITSAYDLKERSWLIAPNKDRAKDIQGDHPDWLIEAVQLADKARSLIDNGSYDEVSQLYLTAHKKRKRAYETDRANANWSQANINYKYLEKVGIRDEIMKIREGVNHG